jgi:hypothetical protein
MVTGSGWAGASAEGATGTGQIETHRSPPGADAAPDGQPTFLGARCCLAVVIVIVAAVVVVPPVLWTLGIVFGR